MCAPAPPTLVLLLFLVPFAGATLLRPGDLIERCVQKGKQFNLTGHSALIVTTSHSKLGPANCTACKETGVFSEEMTAPYWIFADAGMDVSIATIAGGPVPVDPMDKMFTSGDVRFYQDREAQAKIASTPPVAEVDFESFDVVWLAGGWGAAWDLAGSKALIDGVSARYAKGKLLGSVCHGALGFVNATKPDGITPLVQGLNMTAVTDRQIEQLGIADKTPMHPQDELVRRGANYQCSHGVLTDLTASLTVVDGILVTGQNQNSGCQVAQTLLEKLAAAQAAQGAQGTESH